MSDTSTNDEVQAEEQDQASFQQRLLDEGRWAATEAEDNAVFASDPNFVGTDPERQNYAYPVDAPLASEGNEAEDKVFQAAQDFKDNQANRPPVGRQGFSPDAPHPTEGRRSTVIGDHPRTNTNPEGVPQRAEEPFQDGEDTTAQTSEFELEPEEPMEPTE